MKSKDYAVPFDRLRSLMDSFLRHQRARGLSDLTIRNYGHSFGRLLKALDGDVDRAQLEAHFIELRDHYAPSTIDLQFTHLRHLFRWLDEEGEAPNLMAKLSRATFEPPPVDILTDETIARLLKACDGRRFESRRDAAIIRVFNEGVRLGELCGLRTGDVDWQHDLLHVIGKGKRPRVVPMAPKTAAAVDRYARERARHRFAERDDLWLSQRGGFTSIGVAAMLNRRCDQAGIPHVHPHQFRHTAAHAWMAAGGNEGDAMKLFGWRSREMVDRYGASAATERAIAAARRMNLSDRI